MNRNTARGNEHAQQARLNALEAYYANRIDSSTGITREYIDTAVERLGNMHNAGKVQIIGHMIVSKKVPKRSRDVIQQAHLNNPYALGAALIRGKKTNIENLDGVTITGDAILKNVTIQAPEPDFIPEISITGSTLDRVVIAGTDASISYSDVRQSYISDTIVDTSDVNGANILASKVVDSYVDNYLQPRRITIDNSDVETGTYTLSHGVTGARVRSHERSDETGHREFLSISNQPLHEPIHSIKVEQPPTGL